jgi:hypothetical protein
MTVRSINPAFSFDGGGRCRKRPEAGANNFPEPFPILLLKEVLLRVRTAT